MISITVWMNMPSFHQDGLFNALMADREVDLRVVFARETTQDRLRLGWKEGVRDYSHRILCGKFKILGALRIAWSERRRVHVVSGIWAEPSFAIALCVLSLVGSKFVVYAEAPDPRTPMKVTGLTLRRLFGRWVARRAVGLLAVSHFAIGFYGQLGFTPDRCYPFGYFRATDDRRCRLERSNLCRRTELIFVGQLVHRKGVDLLLEAMTPLFHQYEDLALTVVGGGAEARALETCARVLGIKGRVTFEGPVDSDKVQSRLASADALVLPSRWDGWGMVVNEALSAGVPVLVSDRCGSADLIQHGVNGYVFPSEDVEALRACVRRFLDSVDERRAMPAAALSTGRALSAEAAAPYLIKCLKHMTDASEARPSPPWTQVPAANASL